MQYEVMSRLNARKAMYEKEAPRTAMISITDYKSEQMHIYPQSWLRQILPLQFNDVLKGGPHAMTEEHAEQIAAFVWCMYPQVERFVVHCEYGQSRSAGVAAAISDFYEGHDNGISENKAFHPNWYCYGLTIKALKKLREHMDKKTRDKDIRFGDNSTDTKQIGGTEDDRANNNRV